MECESESRSLTPPNPLRFEMTPQRGLCEAGLSKASESLLDEEVELPSVGMPFGAAIASMKRGMGRDCYRTGA